MKCHIFYQLIYIYIYIYIYIIFFNKIALMHVLVVVFIIFCKFWKNNTIVFNDFFTTFIDVIRADLYT